MGKGTKHVTIGYEYRLSALLGLCMGPVDRLIRVSADDKIAWVGIADTDNPLFTINAPGLFGGQEAEGGYAGGVIIGNGGVTDAADTLMTSVGALRPRYNGLLTAYFNDFMWSSMTPYLKPPAFDITRTKKGWNDDAVWYAAKAEIDNSDYVEDATWSYGFLDELTNSDDPNYANFDPKQASSLAALGYTDVPSWSTGGASPFGNGVAGSGSYNTLWGATDGLFIRKTITTRGISSIRVSGSVENSCHIFWDGAKVGGANYTNAQVGTFPSFSVDIRTTDGEHTLVIAAFDEICGNADKPNSVTRLVVNDISVCRNVDMNPAHIVYQTLTDPEWGMGYPTAELDNTSFTAAADQLYAEGFGMSLGWFSQTSIEDFVQMVLQHIDGVLRLNPSTGKFELKLMRDDYVIGDLDVLDTSNVVRVESFSRAAWGELTNEVILKYEDYEGHERVAQAQNLAAVESQGGILSQTIDMPGLRLDELAAKIAQRELLRRSRNLAQATLIVNRTASTIRAGDVVNLQWTPLGISSLAMRVLSVNRGGLRDGEVRLSLVEDMFALPTAAYITPQASLAEDLTQSLYDLQTYKVVEWPYYAIQTEMSAADVGAMTPNSCFGQFFAGAESSSDRNFLLAVSSDDITYTNLFDGDFSAYGYTSALVAPTDVNVVMASEMNLDTIVVGGYGYLGNECVRVDAYDAVTMTLTVGRGCLDTVPVQHAAGTLFILATGYGVVDTTERVAATTVYYKGLPTTGAGTLDEADALGHSITFADRASKPYPPGNFKLNATAYPTTISGELTVSWAHRDRTQQLADIVDTLDASIGPETDVTYTLELYNENGVLSRTASGLTGTSYTWTTEAADSGLDATVTLCNFNGTDAATSTLDPYGRTWTFYGNAQLDTAQKKYGTASLLLDGSGDYLEAATDADFNIGSGDFTIEAWVRVPSLPGAVHPIFAVGPGGADGGYYFGVNNGGGLYWDAVYGGSATSLTGGAMSANTWYHVAVTRQGTTVRLWLAGAQVASATYATFSATSYTARIGRGRGASTGYLNGWVDDFRITKGVARYTAAFTPSTIELLPDSTWSLLHFDGSNASTTFTDSAMTRTWTSNGNAQLDTGTKKFGTAALELDGTGDYVSNTSGIALADETVFTVEMWARFTNLTPTYSPLFYNGDPASDNHRISLLVGSGGVVQAYLQAGTGTGQAISSAAGAVTTATWHHIALTRNGNDYGIFVDGVSVATGTYSTAITGDAKNYIGLARNAGAQITGTTGFIDEFRMSKAVRYTGAFTPATAAFDIAVSSSLNSEVRVVLKSVRSGVESWQEHDWTVAR